MLGVVYWLRAAMLAVVILLGVGLWKLADAAGTALVAAFGLGYFYCMLDLWSRGCIIDPEERPRPRPRQPRRPPGS
jgi:hypothetical protein